MKGETGRELLARAISSDGSSQGERILPEHLSILVHEAHGLRRADWLGLSDPYALVFADDADNVVFNSSIIKQNLNPMWNEKAQLPPKPGLEARNIRVELWDSDMNDIYAWHQDTDDFLGEVQLVVSRDTLRRGPNWYKLVEKSGHARVGVRGRVLLSFEEDTFNSRKAEKLGVRSVVEWLLATGWESQMGEARLHSYVDAFQEHKITDKILDQLCCGNEKRGTKLQQFGVLDLTHCAIIAKGWRQRQRDQCINKSFQTRASTLSERGSSSLSLASEYGVRERRRSFRNKYQPADSQSEQLPGFFSRWFGPRVGASEADMYDSDISDEADQAQETTIEEEAHVLEIARAEVVESERRYVRNLEVVESIFHIPLNQWKKELLGEIDKSSNDCADSKGGLSMIEKQNINSENSELISLIENLEQKVLKQFVSILAVNRELLRELELAHVNGDEIGPVFVRFGPFLRAYGQYVSCFSDISANLARCRADVRLATFMKACELQPCCNGVSLTRYLSLPVHRLPQYCLLLKEVRKQKIKSSEESLPSSNGTSTDPLDKAIALVSDAASFVNEAIRTAERCRREAELGTLWVTDEGKPCGFFDDAATQLIKEGELEKVHRSREGFDEVQVLLLSDSIVYGEELGRTRASITAAHKVLARGMLGKVVARRRIYLKNAIVVNSWMCASAGKRRSRRGSLGTPTSTRSMTSSQSLLEDLSADDDLGEEDDASVDKDGESASITVAKMNRGVTKLVEALGLLSICMNLEPTAFMIITPCLPREQRNCNGTKKRTSLRKSFFGSSTGFSSADAAVNANGGHSEANIAVFQAPTAKEANEWMKAISVAITEGAKKVKSRSQTPPETIEKALPIMPRRRG